MLDAIGIHATCINSSLSPDEQLDRMRRMAAGEYDLVYIAPERLRNRRFLDAAESHVQLLAIDEAHCISEWGHDFRPDYARLVLFRQRLGNPQTIALTATATARVRDDIVKSLELREPRTFVTGFSRPNLEFNVAFSPSVREKETMLLEFLESNPGAGIIYASTRKRCEEVAENIGAKLKRRLGVYHAGLMPVERRQIQKLFMSGELPIIVATNAFGMGSTTDLRFVVHYNIPGSLGSLHKKPVAARRARFPLPVAVQLCRSLRAGVLHRERLSAGRSRAASVRVPLFAPGRSDRADVAGSEGADRFVDQRRGRGHL
ncbi:MAG: helicase-related protein [Pirellulaceae bacterium]